MLREETVDAVVERIISRVKVPIGVKGSKGSASSTTAATLL
jgi:hypothetical protein